MHLNLLSLAVAAFGTTRTKILFDLLPRQWLAFGILQAADEARRRKLARITLIELGVGTGTGLINMCDLAARIERVTGVGFDVVGFDTGQGMPPPADFRDHPELYQAGWFAMNADKLRDRLPSFATLQLGDVGTTIPAFLDSLGPEKPVGFVVLDVDYYSSSRDALRIFDGNAANYLPVVGMYVDDIAHRTHNPACGELFAIDEFNATRPNRRVAADRFLVQKRVFKHAEWLAHMRDVHILDHPERTTLFRNVPQEVLANPYLQP